MLAENSSGRGPALALLADMIISILPRVTGMKIENAWGRGSRGMVRCTARLSRPLRAKEERWLDRLPGTSVEGIEVGRECRPEEIEEWQALLAEVLLGAPAPPARRAAAAGVAVAGPKSRRERKRNESRRTDPAA